MTNFTPVDYEPDFGDSPAPKAGQTVPAQNIRGEMRNAQQGVTGELSDFLGIGDSLRSLRGEMTPDEAQMFALGAVPALIGGPEAKTAEELAPAVARGIKAFHGSPHDFDRFDLSKIGTGEGAQSYGYGLYFAENPAVAESYRNYAAARGRMYEVNINADHEHFLDWDKPFNKQSEHVQKVLRDIIPDIEQSALSQSGEGLHDAVAQTIDQRTPWLPATQMATAAKLKAAGIAGFRYLDQGSRTTSGGNLTSNFVVLDDSLIDIIKKYGLAGAIGSGAAHFKMQPVEHDPFDEGT
jgi:hypothetical protein